ncbi:MAG TPA: FkbM family methyltransferase, partial [Candidatus Saccharimonadales bacterium]|nr:FkbM family methyltransferase [Candidatus Saccharimonadales bacterium]
EKYGEYSQAEPNLWRKIVRAGDTVIDIGANIGALTLALYDLVGGDKGKVLAFEPQPENYKLLLENAKGKNIHTFTCALGAKEGEISVPALSELKHTNYGGIELGGSNVSYRRALHTLDQYTKNMLSPISFIKIDVEGMEAEVLKGAKQTIAKHRPVLYVENDRSEKSAELLQLIFDMNYFVFEHTPLLYAESNFKEREVDEQNIVSVNLLCIPKEKISQFNATDGLRQIKEDKPERPTVSNKKWACVVRLGGIGDNLIASSPLRLLKRDGYMVEVITQEPQSVVFENNPYIDKLTIKSAREIPQDNPTEWQKFWWSRSCEYAKFVNLSHSVEVLMANFQQSTSFWWPAEFRRKQFGGSYLEAAHDIVGVPHDFGPLFFPTNREVEDIADFKHRHRLHDKPLIGWVISGTRVDKLYPYSGLAIARLLAEIDCNVIMMSAPTPHPDAGHAKAIMEHVKLNNSCTDGLYEARHVEGQHNWPIRRMLTLARFCDLVIGPDTGVMWAVAMEPLPKIMMHSHASDDNITKHWKQTMSLHADPKKVPCWPCHLLHDKIDTCYETQLRSGIKIPTEGEPGAACISSVSVDMLLSAAKGMLDPDGSAFQRLIDRYGSQVTIR